MTNLNLSEEQLHILKNIDSRKELMEYIKIFLKDYYHNTPGLSAKRKKNILYVVKTCMHNAELLDDLVRDLRNQLNIPMPPQNSATVKIDHKI